MEINNTHINLINEIREALQQSSKICFIVDGRVHRNVKYPVWEFFKEIEIFLETEIQSSYANCQ
jgi:hypothetical protein